MPLLALARDVAADPRPVRGGFAWGTLAGLGFFVPLVEWLRLVDPLALVLLAGYLSLFVGAFVAGLAAWGDRPGRAVAAVIWWVGLEALRGTAPFGGFPWGLLGYTQAAGGPALPVARVAGVLGVSAVLAATAVALDAAARGRARTALPTLAALVAVPALAAGTAPVATGTSLDVAAVQGFDVEGSTGRALPRSLVIADKMLETTRTAVAAHGPPDLAVWPENAIDGDAEAVPDLRARLDAAASVLDGAPLLAGTILDGAEPRTWENTVLQLEGSASTGYQALDRYVKRRPVPFGEYIPFRSLIGWYPTIQRLRPTDAVRGTEPGVFDVAGARVGVVICFESIFPRLVHSQVDEGADLLVVVTNNSTFGRTALSDQHVAFSQVRAVETGRWVVHAALSGVSALVAPDGEVLQRTGLFEQGVVRADVPLVTDVTVATRLGEAPGWVAMGLSALGLAWLGRSRRRERVPAEHHATAMAATADRG